MRNFESLLVREKGAHLTSALKALLPDENVKVMHADFTIKSVSGDEQIVYGEVYAPYVLDSHGEMMLPLAIKQLAHRFLIAQKNHFIDLQHNNKAIKASVVESYIAKADDPLYAEGAWVLAVQIFDDEVWADVKAGKFNGYSLEAMVYKVQADIEYEYLPVSFGFTEENAGHFHAFYVEVDKEGTVIGGSTGPGGDDGHTHAVHFGTATEENNGHRHRYFLNEIEG